MSGHVRSLRRLPVYFALAVLAVALSIALAQVWANAAQGEGGALRSISGGWGDPPKEATPTLGVSGGPKSEVVVILSRNAEASVVSNLAGRTGAKLEHMNSARSEKSASFAVYGSDELSVDDFINRFEGRPGVVSVSANYTRAWCGVPSDPMFSAQWGLDNTGQTGGTIDADIDAPTAWDTTRGSGAVVAAASAR